MELTLMFAGAVVSVLAEVAQKKFNITGVWMMVLVLTLALLGSALMTTLKYLGYWEVFLQVIVSAGAMYAFIIKNVNESGDKSL